MVCSSGDPNKNYSEFFAETLPSNSTDTYDKLTSIIEKRDETKNLRMPSDDEIEMNIHQRTYGSDDTLPRLFYYLRETANRYMSNMGGFNYFLAETILPKPAKANEINYPPHADATKQQQRETRTKSLGNYILLHQPYYSDITDEEVRKNERKNFEKEVKKHANEPLASKLPALVAASQNVVCSNWLTSRNTWGEAEIDERNRGLVEVIKRVWQ